MDQTCSVRAAPTLVLLNLTAAQTGSYPGDGQHSAKHQQRDRYFVDHSDRR